MYIMLQSQERVSASGHNSIYSISLCGGVETQELFQTGYGSGGDLVRGSKGLDGVVSFAYSGDDVSDEIGRLIQDGATRSDTRLR